MDTNFLNSVLESANASEYQSELAKQADEYLASAQETRGQAEEGISGGILGVGTILGKVTGLDAVAEESAKQAYNSAKEGGAKLINQGIEYGKNYLKSNVGIDVDNLGNQARGLVGDATDALNEARGVVGNATGEINNAVNTGRNAVGEATDLTNTLKTVSSRFGRVLNQAKMNLKGSLFDNSKNTVDDVIARARTNYSIRNPVFNKQDEIMNQDPEDLSVQGTRPMARINPNETEMNRPATIEMREIDPNVANASNESQERLGLNDEEIQNTPDELSYLTDGKQGGIARGGQATTETGTGVTEGVGEAVGEGTGEAVGEAVGELAAGASADALGASISATGILAPIGAAIIAGSTIYEAFEGIKDLLEAHKHHTIPDLSGVIQPQMNFGVF